MRTREEGLSNDDAINIRESTGTAGDHGHNRSRPLLLAGEWQRQPDVVAQADRLSMDIPRGDFSNL